MTTVTVRLFGVPVVAVCWGDDGDADDRSRDLSGGSVASDRITAGPTDLFLGFTNGREA